MHLDAQNLFSEAQDITASAASENIVDLRPILGGERRIGTGENLYIILVVTTTFTDAGSDSTVAVTLEADALEAFGSATTIQTIGTFAALSAIGDAPLIARIAPQILTESFIRLFYTVAGGNLTTGALTAAIVHGIDAFTAYRSGFDIE